MRSNNKSARLLSLYAAHLIFFYFLGEIKHVERQVVGRTDRHNLSMTNSFYSLSAKNA
jgi:hypothetical protein